MGILFAIISSLSQAVGNLVLKKSYVELPSSIAFFLFSIFALLIQVPLAFSLGIQWSAFWPVFGVAVISAILTEALYFYILSKGELSITGTILSSYSIYTILFSSLMNHEHVGWLAGDTDYYWNPHCFFPREI